MDEAGGAAAALPARRPRHPGDAGDQAARGAAALDLSPQRAVARPDLARSSAGQAEGLAYRFRGREALDLCRASDGRRDRAAEDCALRAALFLGLLIAAAAHLLLPLGPLREAQAINPDLADLIM